MLRHRLAGPLLMAHRLRRTLLGPPAAEGAFRILLLHDVPADRMAALAALVDYVKEAHGLLDPAEAAAFLDGMARPPAGRTPCLLTFDDGFVSNAEAARTVLAPRGVRALFFICPGLMAAAGTAQAAAIAGGIFDGRVAGGDIASTQRLMTWDEVATLVQAGHAVGAHGMSHRRLSLLGGAELEAEIADSNTQIAARLGQAPDWYAYAFGDIDSLSAEALAVIGRHYRFCRSGVRGANPPGVHRLAIRADSIDLAAPLTYQKFLLAGGLDGRYGAQRACLDRWAASA